LSTLISNYFITIHLQLIILFYTIETSTFYYLNTAIEMIQPNCTST